MPIFAKSIELAPLATVVRATPKHFRNSLSAFFVVVSKFASDEPSITICACNCALPAVAEVSSGSFKLWLALTDFTLQKPSTQTSITLVFAVIVPLRGSATQTPNTNASPALVVLAAFGSAFTAPDASTTGPQIAIDVSAAIIVTVRAS